VPLHGAGATRGSIGVSGSSETKTYGKSRTVREHKEMSTLPRRSVFGKDESVISCLFKRLRILSSPPKPIFSGKLVTRNVSKLVELPREERQEMRTLSLDQVVDTLLPAIKDDRLCAAFFLAFTAGLRRGELLALRWRDVDLKAGVLQVRQTLVRARNHSEGKTQIVFSEPKTPQSRRTIPIPEECLTALKHHKAKQAEEKLILGQAYEDYGLVFCQPDGKPIDPRNFNRHFSLVLQQAGLPHIRLHDSRHTFATLLLEQGISPKTVQTMLGHSSAKITLDIYSHVTLDLEKQAAAKLNAARTGRRN
jgi:integrase